QPVGNRRCTVQMRSCRQGVALLVECSYPKSSEPSLTKHRHQVLVGATEILYACCYRRAMCKVAQQLLSRRRRLQEGPRLGLCSLSKFALHRLILRRRELV